MLSGVIFNAIRIRLWMSDERWNVNTEKEIPHKTLLFCYGRQFNIFWTLWTSNGRWNNIVCFWYEKRRIYRLDRIWMTSYLLSSLRYSLSSPYLISFSYYFSKNVLQTFLVHHITRAGSFRFLKSPRHFFSRDICFKNTLALLVRHLDLVLRRQ